MVGACAGMLPAREPNGGASTATMDILAGTGSKVTVADSTGSAEWCTR
jgi:hypothetical protein